MDQSVREVMTTEPVALPTQATIHEAARRMREEDIGVVLVIDGDELYGVVTDRDIVIRAIADGRDPTETSIGDICSRKLVGLEATDSVERAVKLMSERAVRRLPVADHGRLVGMVSIGDLAVERDPSSALAEISSSPGNT